MKKLLLGIGVTILSYQAVAQAVVAGVSPVAVQRNFEYGVQVYAGGWPGETDNGSWGFNGSGLNFNTPGDFILDTLVMMDDTLSDNTLPGLGGFPKTQDGCNPSLPGQYTGKVVLIRRNTCPFSQKVYFAQQSGAIAVLVMNRIEMGGANDGETIFNMSASDTFGINSTIPAAFLKFSDGDALYQALQQGTVKVFLGNKMGAFGNDLGSQLDAVIIPDQASRPTILATDGSEFSFKPGIQFVNYGSNVQTNVTIRAKVVGPNSTEVYNETVSIPTVNPADTIPVFNGNTYGLPEFSLASYPVGEYTLTYTLEGASDADSSDNSFSSTFSVTDSLLSLANFDAASGGPLYDYFPRAYDDGYKSCMSFKDANASQIKLNGIQFAVSADSDSLLASSEAQGHIYEWNDADVTLSTGAITDLNEIYTSSWYADTSVYTNEELVSVNLDQPVTLLDGQQYLFCLETFTGAPAFAYDYTINYGGNVGVYDQVISPIYIDNTGTTGDRWYKAGWSSYAAPAFGFNVVDAASSAGIADLSTVEGLVFPNPAKDQLNFRFNEAGDAQVTITDISGKVAAVNTISVVEGKSNMNIATLADGMYIVNVAFANGKSAKFNVIKK